jgi:hypothetical protein
MAYNCTLLMFRKPNKTTINKTKTINLDQSTSFRFSLIFRYIKVFQVSHMFTCGLADLLLLAVGLLIVFVLREYILKVHINYARSEILVSCLVYCFFIQLVDIFFSKAYYQESYILIIEYSSVVAVAEWLDGSFESRSRLEKPNSGSIPESPNICLTYV